MPCAFSYAVSSIQINSLGATSGMPVVCSAGFLLSLFVDKWLERVEIHPSQNRVLMLDFRKKEQKEMGKWLWQYVYQS